MKKSGAAVIIVGAVLMLGGLILAPAVPGLLWVTAASPDELDDWFETADEDEEIRVAGKVEDKDYNSLLNRYSYKLEGSNLVLWADDDIMDTGESVILTIRKVKDPIFGILPVASIYGKTPCMLCCTPGVGCCSIGGIVAIVGVVLLFVKGKKKGK